MIYFYEYYKTNINKLTLSAYAYKLRNLACCFYKPPLNWFEAKST